MTVQTITQLPPAPVPSDSPSEFATKAGNFVPALETFGNEINQFGTDIVNETETVVNTAKSEITVANQGLFDRIVVGDTNGSNKDFYILDSTFNPHWSIYVDGKKVPNSEISTNETKATLTNAPASGVSIEAIAPRSADSVAPIGFKTIAFASNKNGTISISCTSSATTPKWKIGGVESESATFTYANNGEFVYIYLYIPDDSTITEIDAENQGIYAIECDRNINNVEYVKFGYNTELKYINSLSNIGSYTNFYAAWYNNNLTSFPLLDSSNVTNFYDAWRDNNLTSFPLLDSSNVTSFYAAWYNNNLTSFPLLDSSNVTNFHAAWRDNNLTSFPLLDSSNVTNFYAAWRDNNLTSFPLLDSSNVTSFYAAWQNNNLTSFPLLDFSSGTDFNNCWMGNALNQVSVDAILGKLDSDGVSNAVIGLDGGTNAAPSSAGLASKSNLEFRGCTVNVN